MLGNLSLSRSPRPSVEPDKRAAIPLSRDAPLLGPVHSQYTKRPLTALNHPLPPTTLREQYQRFTRLSTIANNPDNDLLIRRSSVRARRGPLRVCAGQKACEPFGSVP